jgi:hypothetical protein
MSQSHSFCVEDAKLYGVECAILINHFRFWVNQNRACKRNFFDGRTWMFQSQAEIAAIYPYWSQDTVQRIIKKLIDFDVIVKGNYNKTAYDRTAWYAFKNEEIPNITRNRGIGSEDQRNGLRDIASPIPDTNKDTKKDLPPLTPPKENFEKPQKEEEEEDFSFLSKYNFSDHELRQLVPFSTDQIQRALKVASLQKVTKSFFGLLLNILRNPEKWPDPAHLSKAEESKKHESKSKFDYAPLNRSYWNQILKAVTQAMIKSFGVVNAAKGWHERGLIECGSYLETRSGEKIYMKDASFLNQVENFLRKNDIELDSLYKFISACRNDLDKQLNNV